MNLKFESKANKKHTQYVELHFIDFPAISFPGIQEDHLQLSIRFLQFFAFYLDVWCIWMVKKRDQGVEIID